MKVWRLKSCPRCQGDIFLEHDSFGWYEECLQCSYHRELVMVEGKLAPWEVDLTPDGKTPTYHPVEMSLKVVGR
ncbi:MAG: hypothetical protein MUO24_03575 [Desulfobacterales bacterium]|nr:hypothetical protein [Desulfobacterales bacterium]